MCVIDLTFFRMSCHWLREKSTQVHGNICKVLFIYSFDSDKHWYVKEASNKVCILSVFCCCSQVYPRYMGIGRQVKDLHMFNILAAMNRVNFHHLPNDRPICKLEDFKLQEMLPSVEDNLVLRNHWSILVGRILVRYIPNMAFMESHLPSVIEHPYMTQMKTKSKVVSF